MEISKMSKSIFYIVEFEKCLNLVMEGFVNPKLLCPEENDYPR